MKYTITGGVVEIDEEDLELVKTLKWHVGSTGYAVWRGIKDGKKQTIRMHRLLTDCPEGLIVDHINHDRLDNRRINLRICDQSTNMRNMKDQGKGYWKHNQYWGWVVELHGKHIACFKTEEEAIACVELVRSGGTYVKPERTHCKWGHSLEDAYIIQGDKRCKPCQSNRSREYNIRKKERIVS